jgi:hypothetical protein
MASNYPPGHPTGTSRGEPGEIYFCDNCNTLWEKGELIPNRRCPTKGCSLVVERAECMKCGEPATHIDTDRAVNANEAFCDEHGM